MVPDPWQQLCLEVILSRVGKKWAHSAVGLSVPRQNGKNAVLEMLELYLMVVAGFRVLHTAHQLKTAREAWKRLTSFFAGPPLSGMVVEQREANGEWRLKLDNGGEWQCVARSSGGGRGLTFDILVLDEAQQASDEVQDALIPAMAAAPSGDPMVILTGTPPSEDMPADWWKRHRAQALSGKFPSLAWLEWSAPPEADVDDLESIALANPAVGRRLQWHYLLGTERSSLSDDSWRRERMGQWDSDRGSDAVIAPEVWAGATDTMSQIADESPLAIAVDISPQKNSACVAVAGWRDDGKAHVEVVQHVAGDPSWWVPRVVDMAGKHDIRALVVDDFNSAVSSLPKLRQQIDFPATRTNGKDLALACAALHDQICGGDAVHLGQPSLTRAIQGATRRKIGARGGWAWARQKEVDDITPLMACTLALHGLQSERVAKVEKPRESTVFIDESGW